VIRTVNIKELPPKSAGFRVLVMRKWPRGIPREAIDLWAKDLGPSPELLKDLKKNKISLAGFYGRYRAETSEPGRREAVFDLQRRVLAGVTLILCCDTDDDKAAARTVLKEILETT
jgi:uncharacterized protein YeaO (DUF488 family)